jgi:hypothetical protein
MGKPRSQAMKRFKARMRFMQGVYPNVGAFLAKPEFDELQGLPTGKIIKVGSVSGELYKVTIAEHERTQKHRTKRRRP